MRIQVDKFSNQYRKYENRIGQIGGVVCVKELYRIHKYIQTNKTVN